MKHLPVIAAVLSLYAGQVAADPLDQPIVGPKRICLRLMSFDLLAGERVTDVQIGVHGSSLSITAADGEYEVSENEILRQTRSWRRPVYRRDQTQIFRSGGGDGVAYTIVGPMEFYEDGKPRQLGWISGPVLRGERADALIYSRVSVGNTADLECDQRIRYGFNLD